MNIPCHDCGCPHTSIKRHIEWAGLKFFLAERICDNCGNSWMALEPLKNLEDNDPRMYGKNPLDRKNSYMENTTHEEREIDEESFGNNFKHIEETHNLIFKLIGEIKDLKIVINNTNKKVKELLTIIDKKVL